MTITRVSTSATFSNTINNYNNLLVREADLSRQLSSGFKADNFLALEDDLREVVNIESSIRNLDGFIDGNNLVNSRLTLVDNALEQIYEVALQLKQDIIVEGSNGDNLELANLAGNALEQVASNLDVRQGSRFLFSGSRISEPASGSIRTFPNVNFSSFELNLDYYRGDALEVSVQATETLEISYGITGDNEAFQNVFAAAHLAIASESEPANRREAILTEAQRLIDLGLEQVLGLRGRVGNDIRALENFNLQHEQVKTQLDIRFSDLVGVDIAEATIEQSLNQTVLQATLQNFAVVSRLNLADFL